jgi:hypothetical protein
MAQPAHEQLNEGTEDRAVPAARLDHRRSGTAHLSAAHATLDPATGRGHGRLAAAQIVSTSCDESVVSGRIQV